MSKIQFSPEQRFDAIYQCYKHCVTSFREKPLSPYEKECIYPCLENHISTQLELHNSKKLFESSKEIINKHHHINDISN